MVCFSMYFWSLSVVLEGLRVGGIFMRGPVFSFLRRRGVGRNFRHFFLSSHHVPIMFPMCSHEILKFSQNAPNSTFVLSHMVCPKFNSHVYKLKRWALGRTHLFLFLQMAVQIGASIGECPIFQKLC